MPKKYPVEVVQPPGKHNKPHPCIPTEHISHYLEVPFDHLNPVQSEFLPHLEDDEDNIIVAAQTSSGKTLCAELFAARGLSLGKKVLYIAPMKALTDEKYYEWQEVEHTFCKRKIGILTGDFVLTEAKKKSLDEAEIIFLTPEMFNSKCRYYDSHKWLHNAVIIVDECHLLGSRQRGDKLEIGLIQYFENAPETRALLLSATIPNVNDFAIFLERNTERKTVVVRSNYRPCMLQVNFKPFNDTFYGKPMPYEKKENARLEAVIETIMQVKEEPTIVFVGSKDFGRRLCERLKILGVNHEFHNADKNRKEKNRIEKDFRDFKFNIMIATTTVAWGCNSPARHVIQSHTSFGMNPMDPSDIHQATGRAGRQGYADRGDAYIMVPKRDLKKEQKRLFGSYEVTSTLNNVETMIFHILSYIENGHIKNEKELYDWHSRTLASVQKERMGVEVFTLSTARNVLDNLEKRQMIKKNDDGNYSTTEMGDVTARMYMSPLDVSDWFRNFAKLDRINPPQSATIEIADVLDVKVAMALAKCYGWSNPAGSYISKAEQRSKAVERLMEKFYEYGLISEKDGIPGWEDLGTHPHVKYGAIFYSLLKGSSVDNVLQSITYPIQQDIGRIINTMKQIDFRYGRYLKKNDFAKGFGWGEEWDKLMYRLRYPGMAPALWSLVSIDGIGQVYASKLFEAGVKTKDDFSKDSNRETILKILGGNKAKKALESVGVSGVEFEKPKKKSAQKRTGKKTTSKKKIIEAEDLF